MHKIEFTKFQKILCFVGIQFQSILKKIGREVKNYLKYNLTFSILELASFIIDYQLFFLKLMKD